MLPYLIAGAIGFGIAKLFEKDDTKKYVKGGSIETIGISKEDYFLVVQNWVYFTFNYPMGFVKDAFNSNHLEQKFSSSYERYGSVGVLMNFWANLDAENRRTLSLWIKNNYFNGDKTKLQLISDDNYAKIITHWNMFCFNFPYGFIDKVFSNNSSHFEVKFIRSYETAGSTGAVNKFFTELSGDNQKLLTDWVYDNYKGETFKDGGGVGADSKTKIQITDSKEGGKIATRTLVKKNQKGESITYELTVGVFKDRKKGYFEIYATDSEDEEYFYAEGGLWIEGGKVTDYDGVYELSEKLRPLMSALNLNTQDVYAEGGMIEHGLRVGDEILEDFSQDKNDDEILVLNHKEHKGHIVNLDKGERYADGGLAKKRRRRANEQIGKTDKAVDKTRVAKPVGYRFTDSLASKLRKDKYEAPTEKQVKKYIGKGIYKENRKNKSDKDRTAKL
jgi:hypothetical protein